MSEEKEIKKEEQEKQVKTSKKGIFFMLFIFLIAIAMGAFYFKLNEETKIIHEIKLPKKEKSKTIEGKFEEVKIYIPNENLKKLGIVEEKIPVYYKKRDKISKILEQNFDLLYKNKLITKPNIEILNIFIQNDIVYLDCGKNLEELKAPNRKNILIIYGIVNSITEVSNIRKVKFLINNKEEQGNFSKIYTRNINF